MNNIKSVPDDDEIFHLYCYPSVCLLVVYGKVFRKQWITFREAPLRWSRSLAVEGYLIKDCKKTELYV